MKEATPTGIAASTASDQRTEIQKVLGNYFVYRSCAEGIAARSKGDEPEASSKIIAVFTPDYRDWLDDFKAHLSRIKEQTIDVEIKSGLERFISESPLLEEVDFSQSVNAQGQRVFNLETALLQMAISDEYIIYMNNYFTPQIQKISESVGMNHHYLSKLHLLESRFAEAKKQPELLRTRRFLGALLLGLSCRETQPLAMVNLIVRAGISHGANRLENENMYKKDEFLRVMEGKVPVQQSDRGLYPIGDIGTEFDDITLWNSTPESFQELYTPLVERRAELLGRGPIYMKPQQGACAFGISRLEYDGQEVTIRTEYDFFHRSVMVLSSPVIYQIIFEGRTDVLELLEESKDEDNFNVIEKFKINGVGGLEGILVEKTTYCQDEITTFHLNYENGEPLGIYCDPVSYFLHHFQFRKVDEKTYKVAVSGENLPQLFLGLEALYADDKLPTYVEEEVKIPKIDGKTWEIRVINFSSEFENATPYAMYAKLGENDFVANISRGGKGRSVEEIVRSAYRQVRPEAAEEEIERLAGKYVSDIETQAKTTVEILSEYLTERARSLDVLPAHFQKVPVDSISTDFIADIQTDSKGKEILVPKLVDLNLFYEYSGLKDVALEAYQKMERAQLVKCVAINRFIENYLNI